MLRVYDKRMEQINLATGLYKKPNSYGNPDSWFRIEWQTRNKFANDLVQDRSLQMLHILKMIFQAYAFADGTVDNHNAQRPPVEFWLSLFDWKDIEKRTVQNANFVEYLDPDQRLIAQVEHTMLRSLMFYISLVGREGFVKACNNYLDNLYLNDPVSGRRYLAFLNRLNQLSISGNLPVEPGSCGLINVSGRLKFSLGGI